MQLTRALVVLGALALAAVGVAYLIVPQTMLSVVGIAASPTEAFLLRTQGVALVAASLFLALIPLGRTWRTRLALVTLAAYLVVSSIVDLRAYLEGIVGTAAIPSVGLRIAIGALCLLAGITRARRSPVVPESDRRPGDPTDIIAADGPA